MYLVGSMTVATGLLLWMEHLVAPPGALEVRPRMDGVLKALKTDRPVSPGTWNDIVISYREGMIGNPTVPLASTEQLLPYHFVINSDGSVDGLRAWQKQNDGVTRSALRDRSIHVCFAGQAESNAVSPEQWNVLVSLVRQLRYRCELPSEAVRLDPQSDPKLRPDIPHQAYQLQQMLLSADIID